MNVRIAHNGQVLMKTLIKILLTMAAILAVMGVISCHRLEDITPQSLGDSDIYNLKQVEDEMVDEQTFESHVDKKILQAVKQMVKTLKPEFKDYLLGKYKLGFLEVSDIDRQNVTMLHNYITEKTLTFSFLQPEIATNFSIVERFLLKNVTDELKLQNQGGLREERIIDQRLAQQLGRIYHLDVIETGVTTESSDFIDINLRMIETKRGRIVAVGSVKIEKTAPVRKWLEEMGK
jgi:hypothetical protein